MSWAILLAFFVQTAGLARAELLLPAPGQMLSLSQRYNPPVLKGIKVFPKEPLRFDFILDPGQTAPAKSQLDVAARFIEPRATGPGQRSEAELKKDSEKLIKYFLAALTIPEKDLWVNLSPYEKDRIIPEAFGRTEMGWDLLAQDYILKQITASLLYPEGETGKAFWKKVYALAQEKYGTTDIPVDTFNKVWIVPDKAEVYENSVSPSTRLDGLAQDGRHDMTASAAYITGSRLKVMLETDYLAIEKNDSGTPLSTGGHGGLLASVSPSRLPSGTGLNVKATQGADSLSSNGAQDIARSVLREIVIPVLEKEVNEGANFAPLRQVYQSLILATWYKKKIKQSLLSVVYVDRNKTAGVNIDDPKEAEKIWQRYVEAFRRGAYNLVREENDFYSDDVVPRKYFSGGIVFQGSNAFSGLAGAYEQRMDLAEVPDAGPLMRLEVSVSSTRGNVNATVINSDKDRSGSVSSEPNPGGVTSLEPLPGNEKRRWVKTLWDRIKTDIAMWDTIPSSVKSGALPLLDINLSRRRFLQFAAGIGMDLAIDVQPVLSILRSASVRLSMDTYVDLFLSDKKSIVSVISLSDELDFLLRKMRLLTNPELFMAEMLQQYENNGSFNPLLSVPEAETLVRFFAPVNFVEDEHREGRVSETDYVGALAAAKEEWQRNQDHLMQNPVFRSFLEEGTLGIFSRKISWELVAGHDVGRQHELEEQYGPDESLTWEDISFPDRIKLINEFAGYYLPKLGSRILPLIDMLKRLPKFLNELEMSDHQDGSRLAGLFRRMIKEGPAVLRQDPDFMVFYGQFQRYSGVCHSFRELRIKRFQLMQEIQHRDFPHIVGQEGEIARLEGEIGRLEIEKDELSRIIYRGAYDDVGLEQSKDEKQKINKYKPIMLVDDLHQYVYRLEDLASEGAVRLILDWRQKNHPPVAILHWQKDEKDWERPLNNWEKQVLIALLPDDRGRYPQAGSTMELDIPAGSRTDDILLRLAVFLSYPERGRGIPVRLPASSGLEKTSISRSGETGLATDIPPEAAVLPVPDPGGIDLTTDTFSFKKRGELVNSYFDVAMLQQMQNAAGFSPVIISVQPMNDLRMFLGLTAPPPSGASPPLPR